MAGLRCQSLAPVPCVRPGGGVRADAQTVAPGSIYPLFWSLVASVSAGRAPLPGGPAPTRRLSAGAARGAATRTSPAALLLLQPRSSRRHTARAHTALRCNDHHLPALQQQPPCGGSRLQAQQRGRRVRTCSAPPPASAAVLQAAPACSPHHNTATPRPHPAAQSQRSRSSSSHSVSTYGRLGPPPRPPPLPLLLPLPLPLLLPLLLPPPGAPRGCSRSV